MRQAAVNFCQLDYKIPLAPKKKRSSMFSSKKDTLMTGHFCCHPRNENSRSPNQYSTGMGLGPASPPQVGDHFPESQRSDRAGCAVGSTLRNLYVSPVGDRGLLLPPGPSDLAFVWGTNPKSVSKLSVEVMESLEHREKRGGHELGRPAPRSAASRFSFTQ